MNTEFLEKLLIQIGDDPGCIHQLRKIVVALAVTGRLGTATSGAALSVLEKLKTQLSYRVTSVAKSRLNLVEAEQLPAGFMDPTQFVPLAAVARIEKGRTGIQQAQPGPFTLITTGISRTTCDHFDFDGAAAIVPLVSSAGHGKASINRLHYESGRFALGTILAAAFPHNPNIVSARFLFEYLSAFKDELLITRMTGTANVTLTIGRLGEVPVPLVPLEAQEMVDKLMTFCDRLETARTAREAKRDRLAAASLARLNAPDPETFPADAHFALEALPALTTRIAHIKQIRQSILNLAVRGKLVTRNYRDESASQLLRRLVAETRSSSRGAATSNQAEAPYDVPDYWQWSTLGQLITFGPQNGLSPKPTNRSDAPKAITLTATTSGIFEPAHFKHVDVSVDAAEAYWLTEGDLLFQRGNTREYVGMAAIYRGPPRTYLFPDLIIRVRVSELMSLPFVHMVAVAPPARVFLSTSASGAQATMPKINQSILCALPVPVPPLDEQHRIVTKVNELMALCDALERGLVTVTTARTRLLEATLFEALQPAEMPVLEVTE